MRTAFHILSIVIISESLAGDVTRLKQQLENLNSLALDYVEAHKDSLENVTANGLLEQLSRRESYSWSGYSSCPERSGIFDINVPNEPKFEAMCDAEIAGPGWLVIMRRYDGSVNFYRNWTQYKNGFGELSGEFFIGLDRLHAITASQEHELYIHVEDFDGNSRYARFDDFVISSEHQFYEIQRLGSYTGDVGDVMSYHRNGKFSTFDKKNENSTSTYTEIHMGAWWYQEGAASNLFGLYMSGPVDAEWRHKSMSLYTWRGWSYSLRVAQMMVKPKCTCVT
ncbi:maker249 [Drosophila busckii]|uniref:Maker249 n=1 Tax=Drosophila busckii TaxID=30019 RepID=A0A0M4ESG5_DROBS|nr:ficolin-2 [Drosophila busckii]ALC47685.1 maker249 [Drosophila busckii]